MPFSKQKIMDCLGTPIPNLVIVDKNDATGQHGVPKLSQTLHC